MAEPFDPDAYLAKRRAPKAQPFDPDDYLRKKAAQVADTPLVATGDPTAAPASALPVREQARRAIRYIDETGNAAGLGIQQGASLGFADEVAGVGAALGGTAGRAVDIVGDFAKAGRFPTLDELGALMRTNRAQTLNDYREGREDYRRNADLARKEAPKAMFGGELVGGALPAVASAGALAPVAPVSTAARIGTGAAMGAGMGGMSGLGNSTGDLTRGTPSDFAQTVQDTQRGALFGGLLGGAASGVGAGLGKAIEKGSALRAEAAKRAEALAREAELKALNSARGAVGGATQGLNRTMENISRVELTPAQQQAGDMARRLLDTARVAREEAANLRQGLIGRGREEAVEASGEWLSRGSKLDQAQRAGQRAKQLEAGAERAEAEAAALMRMPNATASNADAVTALEAARQRLMSSPEWAEGNARLLASQLDEFGAELTRATAAQQAFRATAEGFDDAVASRAERLVGPAAATDWAKRMALRYGAPATGAVLGAQAGGATGALLGLAGGGGVNALAGLAGAGLRPALQAGVRGVTQNPAVMNATGRLLQSGAPLLSAGQGALPVAASTAQRAVDAEARAQDRYEMLRRALEGSSPQP